MELDPPRKVLVLGWGPARAADLLAGLQAYAPGGSKVVFVGPSAPAAVLEQQQRRQQEQQSTNGKPSGESCGGQSTDQQQQQGTPTQQQQQQQQSPCVVEHFLVSGPVGPHALLGAGLGTADALIIGSDGELCTEEADAQVVGALLAVQEALMELRGGAGTGSNNSSAFTSSFSTGGLQKHTAPAYATHSSTTGGTTSPAAVSEPLASSGATNVSIGGCSRSAAGRECGIASFSDGPPAAQNAADSSSCTTTPEWSSSWGGAGFRGFTARNSSSTGEGSHRLHVVAALHSYSLRRTVQQFLSGLLCCPFSFELVILDEYASAVVVQVSLLISNTPEIYSEPITAVSCLQNN